MFKCRKLNLLANYCSMAIDFQRCSSGNTELPSTSVLCTWSGWFVKWKSLKQERDLGSDRHTPNDYVFHSFYTWVKCSSVSTVKHHENCWIMTRLLNAGKEKKTQLLLSNWTEHSNRQGRRQTSEQDETRALKARAARGGSGGMPPRILWNLEAQKCSFKHFPWHFSSEKSILSQNQDEAIASSCLMLATALTVKRVWERRNFAYNLQ